MDNEKVSPRENITKDIRFERPTFIDPLTGLFNRYYLFEFLPQEIRKSQASNYSLGVFIIDIDNFKDLNDKYGHLTGDTILKQFSDFLKTSRRQTDMVIRYAGDEFMVLLPGVDRKVGLALGKRLAAEVEKKSFIGKNKEQTSLTISIGFSLCPVDAADTDRLIDLADKALYLSKERGRNQISSAEEVTLEKVSSRIALDSFPCPKFIGRYDEIMRLKQTLHDTVLGRSHLEAIFISGPLGVGKTRISEEVAGYAKDRTTLLSATARLKSQEDPYYLFIVCLNNYLTELGISSPEAKELFSALDPKGLTELVKVLPVTQKSAEGKPVDKETRALLFKAFLDLVLAINKTSALTICLNNVQWADSASIELLYHLIQYEKKRKIFILVNFNEEAPGGLKKTNKIRQLLGYLCDAENVIEMKLANLSLRHTCEMTEAMFPGLRQIKDFNNLLFDITKGSPAFIEEVLASLLENKLIVYKNNAWGLDAEVDSLDIPRSLNETIKKRLNSVDKETKEMILQAAVIGDDFSVELLKNIGDKNEGEIFKLMAKAKKMHLIKETEKVGNFNFASRDIHDVLYSQLSDEERVALHKRIGQTLVEAHKQDLSSVAGDVSFHFDKTLDKEAAARFARLAQEKSAALFKSAEIVDYLKEISPEAIRPEEEEPKAALPASITYEISRLIRIIQAAVRNFRLYPKASSIRGEFVKDIYQSLCLVLAETPKLRIMEAEKSLIINGKRLSTRESLELGGEEFVSLLIEGNIKAISFIQDVTKEEVASFVDKLSHGRQAVTNEGGWKNILNKDNIVHIKIDEFSYERIAKLSLGKTGKRKKFEDAMMAEFLMGKLDRDDVDHKTIISKMAKEPGKFAEAMTKMVEKDKKEKPKEAVKKIAEGIKRINSQVSPEEGATPAVMNELSKVVMELDWKLKNKFIRTQPEIVGVNRQNITEGIIKSIPDEGVIKLVEDSYIHQENNVLVLKDLVDKVLPDRVRRKKLMPLIEDKLRQLGMDKELIRCVIGDIPWDKLSTSKRVGVVKDLPGDEFEIMDIQSLGLFLEELLDQGRNKEIKELLSSLLSKISKIGPKTRQKLETIIKGFITKDKKIGERVQPLLELLKTETDRDVYIDTLETVREIIGDAVKKVSLQRLYLNPQQYTKQANYRIIVDVFSVFKERLNAKQLDDGGAQKSIRSFISEMVNMNGFWEVLVFSLLYYFQSEPSQIKDILVILGGAPEEGLINLCFKQASADKDSFEGYVVRKRICRVLKEIGKPAIEKIKNDLSKDLPKENIVLLLEMAGFLKSEEVVNAIEGLLYSRDSYLRKQAIFSLGQINTEKTKELLSKIASLDSDKQIRALAKKILDKK